MEETVINGFKYGLDTRRDVLSSQPGTLVTCENAHINAGSEIEKRKAFVLYANLQINDAGTLHLGVHGLEATDVGLTAFGSALPFGTVSNPQSEKILASAMPAGVTYQQLRHPTLINDTTIAYNDSYHRLTNVITSENFNGKAFVVAEFADLRRFLYYDGDLVQDSANGVVMELRATLADLSDDLVRQVDVINWAARANLDEDGATTLNGSTLVYSPANEYFQTLPEDTSTAGYIGSKVIAQDGTIDNGLATPGTKASASFQITGNSGTFALTAPDAADGTGSIDLCGGAIAALGTATLTAASLAKCVNDLTDFHGYSAVSIADIVIVYAPVTFGAVTFNLTVTYTTGTVGAAPANVPTTLVATTLEPIVIRIVYDNDDVQKKVVAQATCKPSGGTPPYHFAWRAISANGITATPDLLVSDSNVVSFSKYCALGETVVGQFTCRVTDSSAGPAYFDMPVNVTLGHQKTINNKTPL